MFIGILRWLELVIFCFCLIGSWITTPVGDLLDELMTFKCHTASWSSLMHHTFFIVSEAFYSLWYLPLSLYLFPPRLCLNTVSLELAFQGVPRPPPGINLPFKVKSLRNVATLPEVFYLPIGFTPPFKPLFSRIPVWLSPPFFHL